MVSFEIFVKSMPPSLLELKVIPSFCFAFKIPDDVTATNMSHFDKLLVTSVIFFVKRTSLKYVCIYDVNEVLI
jgi:hypothetical protein